MSHLKSVSATKKLKNYNLISLPEITSCHVSPHTFAHHHGEFCDWRVTVHSHSHDKCWMLKTLSKLKVYREGGKKSFLDHAF